MWRLTSASLPAKESPSSIHLFCLSKANSNGIISFAFSINRDTLLWVPAPQEGADKRLDGLTPNPTHPPPPTPHFLMNKESEHWALWSQCSADSLLNLPHWHSTGHEEMESARIKCGRQTIHPLTIKVSRVCIFFTQINGNVHWKCKKKEELMSGVWFTQIIGPVHFIGLISRPSRPKSTATGNSANRNHNSELICWGLTFKAMCLTELGYSCLHKMFHQCWDAAKLPTQSDTKVVQTLHRQGCLSRSHSRWCTLVEFNWADALHNWESIHMTQRIQISWATDPEDTSSV